MARTSNPNIARPAACRQAAAWMAVCIASLAGCASHRAEQAAADTEQSASASSAVKLEVDAPRPLKALLSTHLDLARLPKLAGDQPLSPAELERLVALAPDQARELIATEGYFAPDITATREGGTPPGVRIKVDPGPRTQVKRIDVEIHGKAADSAAQGDAHARHAIEAARGGAALKPGDPFRNEAWQDSKAQALTALWNEGYREARWQATLADIDMAASTATLSMTADSGPLYRTGPLRIRGLDKQDEETVRNLANFGEGVPATSQLLLDFQERLQTSGLFDRSTVTIPTHVQDTEHAPVDVRLSERKLQDVTLGLGVTSDVGTRATFEHTHRRAFGQALTGRNALELSGQRQSWNGELRTHARKGLYQYLVGGTAERVDNVTDVETSARLRVGRSLDTPTRDSLLFIEAERSLVKNDARRESSRAVSAHQHIIWRRLDNLKLPTDGEVLGIQIGGGQATSDPGGSGPFVRGYARLLGYRPLGDTWHGQLRLEAGQVFSADDVVPPASMRFRAGGQDSVRGYEYRSLAPTVNGLVTGGKVLATASVEVARPILRKYPDLWGALFIDAGRAANRWSDLKPAIGIGAGVRYRSPVGPVSVDLAWGEEERRFRLHVNVGVTF